MRILFDIGHPSFVHLFVKPAQQAISLGHDVLFSYRNKDRCDELLAAFNLHSVETGKHYTSKTGKLRGLFINSWHLFRVIRKFKPDIILSGASPYASLACGITGKKHFVFDDTENREQVMFYRLGSTLIFTPEPFLLHLGNKHVKYPGLHELSYLPGNIIKRAKPKDKPTVFFRFVSWNATHDFFRNGLSVNQKIRLVEHFKNNADIIISSEQTLPSELEKYRYKGPVERIHETLQTVDLFIGESATMASEAACLNVPAIYCDPVGRSYTDRLETDYQLVYNFRCGESALGNVIKKADELLKTKNEQNNYKNFSRDYINLSAFIYWLIENSNLENLKEVLLKKEFFKQFKGIG
ncbi:hypothetical protein ACE01N_05300 [Saccharicrinis sp. FJH2]|uniref:hypothetical protein n=1 Tax=Saccharicrinis sp. FJH65 TaxID=3344659 RepID=UPI0035F3A940